MAMTQAPVTLEILEGPEYKRDEKGWEHHAYKVQLRRGDESMISPWMQGLAFDNGPTAADVLTSLLMDAAGFLNAQGFEDWAKEYGYDTDSRKAYAMYQQVDELTEQLRDLLGDDFETAVFPTEADEHDSVNVAWRLTRGA